MSSLPADLYTDASSRQPISLKLSSRLVLHFLLFELVAIGFLTATHLWPLWVAAVVIVVGAAIALACTERRIDVDGDGITIVPALPIRPAQRFRFDSPGAFVPRWQEAMGAKWMRGYSPPGYVGVQVPITGGPSYRFAGVFPQRTIKLNTLYAAPGQPNALSIAELCDLLEMYRTGHAPDTSAVIEAGAPSPPPAVPAGDDGADWVKERHPFPPRSQN